MTYLFSSYSRKLITLILLLSLVPIFVISGYLYFDKVETENNNLKERLLSISGIGADNISQWIEQRKMNIQGIADNQVMITETQKLLDPDVGIDESFIARFNLEKQINTAIHGYDWLQELAISDPQTGDVIFYTGLSFPDDNLYGEQHFQDAVNRKVGISKVQPSVNTIKNEYDKYDKDVPTLLISVPISGEVGVEGILTASVNIFKINPHVKSYLAEFGSADLYLVNSNGFFISKSTFPQTLLDLNLITERPELELQILKPQSQQFTDIFRDSKMNGTAWNLDGYHNYLGNLVVGSITPVIGTEWSFIVEVDKNEAYQEIYLLQTVLLTLIAILLSVTFVSSYIFANNLVDPIKTLTKTVQDIRTGKKEATINPKLLESEDEVSVLAKTFDSTFRELQESQQQLLKTKNEQIDNLKEIDTAKAEFLTMISHEFKNPLFPIMGFSQMLQKPKFLGELNSKQLIALEKILKNAKKLDSMIINLLDIQQLELGTMKFNYVKFKVDDLMRDVCKKFESKMIERKIQLVNTTRDHIVIQSDELRIKQIFSHLIENAIVFVPKENGKIEICAQETDDTVLFYVKDNGVGISKDKHEDLFKKFYQASRGHKRVHGGVGLGISICKGIIEALGGKIWVESEPGKGASFYFSTPKTKEEGNKNENIGN
ncbi:MAG: sensor histidine kinase [Nitrosopumilus sp.]|nr:sensor histidine kinase [Nitrosopumilus sp.]MDH3793452.1 sensor histidine kinase [Nitrosopumilus sp.]MDH3854498.1 sensor histidine kinase [Nitrosopumilus sp.]